MVSTKTHISVASAAFALVCLGAQPSAAAVSIKLSGAITGYVLNEGVPQMGAAVSLFNRQDKLTSKAVTNDKGEFAFAGLFPDVYSVRVTLASFVPAVRNNILVQPGMRSVLNVNMAALFSSIHLMYPVSDPSFVSDDWKWVLRTATSTRPVMRMLPDWASDAGNERKPVFSDTRALVMLNAGDGSPARGFGSSADMGTAFALETSLFGSNQLQFAGNVGSGAESGIPSAAFRTTYSREVGPDSPQISVTMRELFLPAGMGQAIFGGQSAVPMLRSMSAGIDDRATIGPLSVRYGTSIDAVQFNERLTYLSPYARLTYALDKNSELEFDFTSGNARPDLGSGAEDDHLQQQIGTLGMFPLVSLRGGQSAVQRGQDMEAGYSRTVGSRKFSARVYHESIRNLALTISAPDGFLPVGDVLPNFYSDTAVFNAGNFASMGYLASATQNIGEHVSATVTYGSMGALKVDGSEVAAGNPDELRAMIHAGRQQSLSLSTRAASPHTGTQIIASYQIADNRWTVADPIYSTGTLVPMPGLNIYVRQAIPGVPGLPVRMELTADLRNLLQQGYLPLPTADGSRLVLMETPRMFRGGLSFIF